MIYIMYYLYDTFRQICSLWEELRETWKLFNLNYFMAVQNFKEILHSALP